MKSTGQLMLERISDIAACDVQPSAIGVSRSALATRAFRNARVFRQAYTDQAGATPIPQRIAS